MSSSLYYRPTKQEQNDPCIGYLKYIIREDYLKGNEEPVVFSRSQIPFLQGVRAGSPNENIKKDCSKLIQAIEKFDEVELYFSN